MNNKKEFTARMAEAKQVKKISLPDTAELIKKITTLLKQNGSYQETLDFAIATAAGSYRAFLLAQSDVAKLKKSWYETLTREGNKKLEAHPAIKTMKDCQSMTIDALKCLGLTMELLTTVANDPLEELQNRFNSIDNIDL